MRTLTCALAGASVLALTGALAPSLAMAQGASADSATISEVVVTARRSAEDVQKVPLAITVTSSSQLQERGITDLQGIARYTPSLSFKDYVTAFHGNPTIRGMTQINTVNPVTNVGVFVDGVYLQRDYQLNLSLGDFERIEVVKGPQSALYGSNTFAGAINYVTKQPTDTLAANVEATAGSAGIRRVQAGVGGPIIKGVLDGRVYVGQDLYDGTIRNHAPVATGPDKYFGRHDRSAYSGALKFTPTEYLTFDVYYAHTQRKENIRPFYTISGKFIEDKTNCGTINASTGRPQLFCGPFPTSPAAFRSGVGNGTSALSANIEPDALAENDLLKFGAEWKINSDFTLNYIYGSTRGSASEDYSFHSNTYNPATGSGVNPTSGPSTSFSQQIEGGKIRYTSHEVRLSYDPGSAFKGEVGYFHSNATDQYFLGLKLVFPTGGPLPPFSRFSDDPLYAPPGTIFLNNLNETFKVDAVFGRASLSLLDNRATLTGELRYTQTRLQFMDLNYLKTHPTAPPLSSEYKDWTPRFTAEFKITPDNLLYASAAKGIKTGGFNGYASGTLTLLPSEQSFDEESNWTYEVGLKNVFLGGKLFFNIDAFYINWDKKQASIAPSNLPPVTTNTLTTVANIYRTIGAAKNYGVEVEGQYKPITQVTLNFSGSIQNPKYSSDSINTGFVGYCSVGTCPINGSIGGNQLERQSNYSATAGAEWKDHFMGDWSYFGGIDMTYQSKQYAEQENISWVPSFTLFNARAGFENDTWRAFVWAKNLTDKLYVDNVFYVQGQQQYTASFGERRTIGVTLAGKF